MYRFLLTWALLLVCLTSANAQQCNNNISLYTQSDVDAFPSRNLSVVNGSLTIQASGSGSNTITNLNGLSSITQICGNLYLRSNYNLVSLAGLQNLTSVGGIVWLDYNSKLTDLTGLNNLQTIGLDLKLDHNDDLTSLNGLGTLRSIGRNLTTDNSNLRLPNLSGLNSLTQIAGTVSINGSNFLNLQGLNRIKTIGGSLQLNAVRSFAGLDSLTSINGELSIRFTPITSLVPIGSLSGLTSLTIQGNSNLSVCHVFNVCQFLQNINGRPYLIQGNANGCATDQQILTRCATITAAQTPAVAPAPAVYPNPAHDYLTQSAHRPYRVYDTCGRTQLQGNAQVIPVSNLPSGIYFLQSGNQVVKFIKE